MEAAVTVNDKTVQHARELLHKQGIAVDVLKDLTAKALTMRVIDASQSLEIAHALKAFELLAITVYKRETGR